MTDTPDQIKEIQLKIWLSKSPAERLRQFLIDNDTLMQFWRQAKQHVPHSNIPSAPISEIVPVGDDH